LGGTGGNLQNLRLKRKRLLLGFDFSRIEVHAEADAAAFDPAAQDVAEELARLPQILSINLVTGAKDIEILLAVQEFSGAWAAPPRWANATGRG